jgi:hypothetical protein
MHFHHQLFYHPPVDGVNGTGVSVIEISLGIRDSADVIHVKHLWQRKPIVSLKDTFAKQGDRTCSLCGLKFGIAPRRPKMPIPLPFNTLDTYTTLLYHLL